MSSMVLQRFFVRYIVLLWLVMGLASGASAQTAHGYVQTIIPTSTLGSNGPYNITSDAYGNYYIADTLGSRVLKETPLAGGGFNETVIATAPSLKVGSTVGKPTSLAVDVLGNVYVVDQNNNSVLKYTLSGSTYTKSTVWSTGLTGPWGIAVDKGNPYATLYVTDSLPATPRILKYTTSDGTSYTQAVIGNGSDTVFGNTAGNGGNTYGIALDAAGNIYMTQITTGSNTRVIKGTPNPSPAHYTYSVVVPGTATAMASSNSRGIGIGANGDLYIASIANNNVVKAVPSAGVYGAPYTAVGSLLGTQGVSVDSQGNIYIADTNNSRVMKETPDYDFGSIQVGSTSATQVVNFTFDAASTLASPAYSVFTLGASTSDFSATTASCSAGSKAVGASCTVTVKFNPSIPGTRYGMVVLNNNAPGGPPVASFNLQGTGTGPQVAFTPGTQSVVPTTGMNGPQSVAIDGNGNIYIVDTANNRILKVTSAGVQSVVLTTGLNNPQSVAVDGNGNVYIADTGNNRVLKETLFNGSYTQSVVPTTTALNGPKGVAVDGIGNIYIADTGNSQVLVEILQFGGDYAQSVVASGLNAPRGITVDGSGNVYIADTGNNRVLLETFGAQDYLTYNYTQSTIASPSSPMGVAVDASGSVYIANAGSVTKATLLGGTYTPTTLVTGLTTPTGVALDGSGNVYVSDSGANQVVKESYSTPPTLAFAKPTAVGTTSGEGPKTVAVINIGNAPLTIEPPTTGNNPSISTNFDLNAGTNCPILSTVSSAQTVAAGAFCNLQIDFAPVTPTTTAMSPANIIGAVVLTDNTLNALSPYKAQTIPLSGIGVFMALTPTSLPQGGLVPYSQTVTAAGGYTPTYSYAVTAGTLPAGLTLNSATGLISGTPTAAGNSTFTITATDGTPGTNGGPFTASQSYMIAISAGPVISWSDPAATTYGTPLSPTQLDAVVVNGTCPGGLVYSPVAGTVLAAGTQTLTVSCPSDGTISPASVTLTVNPLTVTVTAGNDSRVYGTANPSFTYTNTALISPDTLSSLGVTVSTSTTATTVSSVGTYPITPSGPATSGNYAFAYVPGILTVTQATPGTNPGNSAVTEQISDGVSAPSTSATVMYGNDAELYATIVPAGATGTVTFTTIVAGSTVTLGSATPDSTGLAVLPESTLPVGTYTITAVYNGDPNIASTISTNTVTLTVTQRTAPGGGPALIITIDDQSRGASSSNPTFTYGIAGALVNGDTYATAVTGTPNFSSVYGGSTPGTYPINYAAGGLTSANYLIQVIPGTLAVNPDAGSNATTTVVVPSNCTITPTPCTEQYGDTVTLTATVTPGALTVAMSGTVSFYDGSTYLGQGTVSSGIATGIATITVATLNAGDHNNITAVYNGDGTYTSSTSVATEVVVNKKTAADGTSPALTVTVPDASRMYGNADPQFVYVVTGALVNGDTYATAVTGVPVYATADASNNPDTATSPAGSTFDINLSGVSSSNYLIQIIPGTLTITDAASTTSLTIGPASPAYGDPVTLTANVASCSAMGDVVAFIQGSVTLGTATTDASGVATLTLTTLPAGTETITASYQGNDNCGGSTSGPASTTVSPKPLHVTVQDVSRAYGLSNPAFIYVVNAADLVNGDTTSLVNGNTTSMAITGTPVYTTNDGTSNPIILTTNVGNYTGAISIMGGLSSTNYTLIFANGEFDITKSNAAVTVTSSEPNSTYGDSVTFTAVVPPGGTGTVSFTDSSNNPIASCTNVPVVDGVATCTTAAMPAGSDTVNVSYSGDSNYNSSSNSMTQTVAKAVLTVTPNGASRVYGTANPTFTYAITGFVNGDMSSVVSGVPSLTTAATATSPVGTYLITAAGTLTATNYTFTYANGNLAVTQATPGTNPGNSSVNLQISSPSNPTPSSSATVMYGNAAELYATVAPAGATGTVTFTATPNGGGAAVVLGTASVDSAGLAVLPTSTLPVGTYTITSVYNGDQDIAATTSNPVTLTVTKRTAPDGSGALVVTVDDQSRGASSSNPTFTYGISGALVNGDTYATAVTGTPNFSSVYSGSTPGSYPINFSASDLTSANYTIQIVPGTLKVNPDASSNATKTVVVPSGCTVAATPCTTQYGDTVTFTATVTPGALIVPMSGTVSFYDGSTYLGEGTISAGGIATITVATLNAGNHNNITAVYNGDGTYTSSTSSPADVLVNKKTAADGTSPALTVTVQDASRMYGNADPQFVYVVTGALVNGDTYATAVTGVPVYATADASNNPDTATSPAGSTFAINLSGVNSSNYVIQIVPGTLMITNAASTTSLTIGPASPAYGDPITLTANVASCSVAGDVVAFIQGSVTLGTATVNASGVATLTLTTLPAGTETITASYQGDANCGGSTSGPATTTVSPKPLTVTVTPVSRVYGLSNPAFSYTVNTSQLVNGDTATTAVTGVPVYTTNDGTNNPIILTTNAGNYVGAISITGGLSSTNYALVFVNGEFDITKVSTPIAVTAGPQNAAPGDPVVITAKVPAGATGTITFTDASGNVLCTTTIVNGAASCTTTTLPVGTDTIRASYSGDSNFSPISGTTTETIAKAVLTISVVTSPNPSTYGQSVTISATVPTDATGTVTFKDASGNVICTATASSGVARCTSTTLPVGSDLVIANYSGDTKYQTGTASTTQKVNMIPTTTTTSVSSSTITAGATETLTSNVGPAGVTGNVEFFSNGVPVPGCTSVPLVNGVATCQTTSLAAGTNQITSTYLGNTSYSQSASTATAGSTVTVNPVIVADFAVALTPPVKYAAPGGSVSYNVQVTSVNGVFSNLVNLTLTVNGVPLAQAIPGATYTLAPTAVTPGVNGVSSTLTITLPQTSAANQSTSGFGSKAPFALAVLLLPLAAFKRARGKLLLCVVAMLIATGAMTGCSPGGYFGQPQKSYTVMVTGTSGTLTHNSNTATLTVE